MKALKIKSIKQYNKNNFKFTINYDEQNLTFFIENSETFPIKLYEHKLSLKDLQNIKSLEDFNFKTIEKYVNLFKKCVDLNKYDIEPSKNENAVIFTMYIELLDNATVEIKIPEKGNDLNIKKELEALESIVYEIKQKVFIENNDNLNLNSKYVTAVNSFVGTSILTSEEKKMISEWIDPIRTIKFNLLFSTEKDGDSSSTFHYYCDGISPTVVVVLDTSNRKFGGYCTHNWAQSPQGSSVTRAPGSFIFNLTNKKKYDLIDQFCNNALYRNNSYGPSFGSTNDLYICSGCKSSTSSQCSKSYYNTENCLISGSSSTSFQVSNYEVYHVIFI